MLAVLCLIALFLNVGAQIPANDDGWADELVVLLDKIGGSFLQKMKDLKEMPHTSSITDKPTSQEYPGNEDWVDLSTSQSDKYITGSATVASTPSYTKSPPKSTSEYVTPEKDYEESRKNLPSSLIGSIRGTPGINFPDYTDIPFTSFGCSSKDYIPGFYADMETGCQVFHVCWPHRRESFLCPIGTTFNQAILACDFWYSSNCSLASYYYNVNAQSRFSTHEQGSKTTSMIDFLLGRDDKLESASLAGDLKKLKHSDLSYILKFLPVKAKISIYPETADTRSKIIAEASIGKNKARGAKKTVTKPLAEALTKKVDYARHGLTSALSIVQEVLEFVGNILGETEEIYSAINSAKRSQPPAVHKPAASPTTTKQHRPLTQLNPRFITKPIAMPKPDMRREKPIPIAKPQVTKVTHTSRHIHSTSGSREQLNVSKLTKNALVKNYLKLFQMRGR